MEKDIDINDLNFSFNISIQMHSTPMCNTPCPEKCWNIFGMFLR